MTCSGGLEELRRPTTPSTSRSTPNFPADPVVLQRVIVDVLADVERHAPAVTLVRVTAAEHHGAADQLCISQ